MNKIKKIWLRIKCAGFHLNCGGLYCVQCGKKVTKESGHITCEHCQNSSGLWNDYIFCKFCGKERSR